jgi:hypothetical protein
MPRVVHQIWETSQIPEEWRGCVQSWREHHPDWDYKLWTAEEREALVAEQYPDFINTYRNYSYAIQRADAARYLILHTYGGVYADLDLECLRPIDRLLEGWSFVLGAMPLETSVGHRTRLVANAFIAATAGHPLLAQVIETLKRSDPRITTHAEVSESTGPAFLTHVLLSYQESDLCVLEPHVLYPFAKHSAELTPILRRETGYTHVRGELVRRGSYAIHYSWTSWARNLAGDLNNPDPHDVAGYKFYPGLDSVGRDIRNVGRDIQILAAECDKDGTAVAFNTDGFLKFRVRPRPSWVRRDNPNGNEGLYVKTGWRAAFRRARNVLFHPGQRRR